MARTIKDPKLIKSFTFNQFTPIQDEGESFNAAEAKCLLLAKHEGDYHVSIISKTEDNGFISTSLPLVIFLSVAGDLALAAKADHEESRKMEKAGAEIIKNIKPEEDENKEIE